MFRCYSYTIIRERINSCLLKCECICGFGQRISSPFGMFFCFFTFVVIVLTIMLCCTFRRISLLSLYLYIYIYIYIYIESRLIPTLFLILGWGYQPERVQAGIYLLFYTRTLLASLPLLVVILFVYNSLWFLCLFLLCGNISLFGGLFYACMVFALFG